MIRSAVNRCGHVRGVLAALNIRPAGAARTSATDCRVFGDKEVF